MRVLAWIAVGLLAVVALDRVALWAESRGWLYWRRRKADTGTLGGALLEIQRLVEPGQRHVAEAREERPATPEGRGEPPEPVAEGDPPSGKAP